MEIMVRNMVCRHCVEALRQALEAMDLGVVHVEIGRAVIQEEVLDEKQLAELDRRLADAGFERVKSRQQQIADRVRRAVIEHVRTADSCRLNLSACLSEKLAMSYDTLSRAFSQEEGRSIEKYFIIQKIEYVKELIGYGEFSLTEIADRAGYSSVAHLSRQFKEVTGLTPTQYIAGANRRCGLNEI